MSNFILGFKFALSYFTILPVKFKEEDDLSKKEILNYTLFFLPFVGLILGFLTVTIYTFLDSIPILGGTIASCVYFVLYGFIHTEAVLDVVDAIYAKHSGKNAYKIIKEPTVGAIGVLYSIVFVLIKICTFSFLLYHQLFFELIAITIISRVCLQFSIYFSTFRSSFVTQIKNSFTTKSFLISIIFFSLLILYFTQIKFLYIILISFLLTIFITNFIKRKLGFLNGDVLGILLEFIEIILSIMVCYLCL